MKVTFLAAAAAAALGLAGGAHAQSQQSADTTAVVKNDAKTAGHAVADSARSVGHSFKEGTGKVKAAVSGKTTEPAPKS